MAYNKLKFYDSDSNELNLVQNNGVWEGTVYLPLVSTGLYETLTLHILEEVRGNLGEIKYIKPIAESDGDVEFEFEFDLNYGESEDIYLYSARAEANELYVQVDKTQSEGVLNSTTTILIDNQFKVVNGNLQAIPVTSKIALTSEVEGFHIRTLNIYEKVNGIRGVKIANIKIYGEVEGEDERLKVLLTNMSMNLDTTDFYIFKSSDIQEGSPDFKILNEKRKELLLQASQIKPFIGTYKALLHAIDFFGYDKLTLKEYWLNINEQSENFGKLQAIAVPNQDVIGFLADKNKSKDLPNSNQKKTSRFSLVYRINAPTGEFDQWDIPKVEEVLEFSPDEVLIKLYGLKRKLQREYLPLQAKIVDITGEADYFSQFNQNIWNNQHGIKNQQAGVEFDFDLIPNGRNIFIEDLRKVDYRLTGINQDFNNLNDRSIISESIKNFYAAYYNQSLDTFNTVDGIPIGAPIVLELTDMGDTWNDAQFTWMDAEDTGNSHLQWNNWWHRSVYEVEWVLRGPRNYFKAFRGAIEDYKVFPLVLPFDGTYTVDANLYDLYNVKSTKTKKDFIEVKNKAVEVYGLTQFANKKLNWNQYKYTWNQAGSSWNWGRENISTIEDNIATFYLTLDRANYITDDTVGAEFSTVRRFLDPNQSSGFNETPGPYQWRELPTHVWNDGPEVTWDMTRVGGDINSSFKIRLNQSEGYQNGHNLEITQLNPITNQINTDSYQIISTYPDNNQDLVAWQRIAKELNNLDSKEHPILSKFNYNEILVDNIDNGISNTTGPQGEDICEFILAVGEEPSKSYDFNTISFDNIKSGNGYKYWLKSPELLVTDNNLSISYYTGHYGDNIGDYKVYLEVISNSNEPDNNSVPLGLTSPIYSENLSSSNFYSSRSHTVSNDYVGYYVRVVWEYTNGISGTYHQGDFQLDDMNLFGTSFDPEDGISNGWQTSTNNTPSFDSVSFTNLANGTSVGRWNRGSSGTPSTNTGITSGKTGMFYYYVETSSQAGEITDPINFTSYNPSFDDTYIINSQATLHLLNHLTFSYDLTNMPGIISQRWRLINNTLNIDDIYYNNQWLTYLFKYKGDYTIELELTDLNGNKNKTTKNILKIV